MKLNELFDKFATNSPIVDLTDYSAPGVVFPELPRQGPANYRQEADGISDSVALLQLPREPFPPGNSLSTLAELNRPALIIVAPQDWAGRYNKLLEVARLADAVITETIHVDENVEALALATQPIRSFFPRSAKRKQHLARLINERQIMATHLDELERDNAQIPDLQQALAEQKETLDEREQQLELHNHKIVELETRIEAQKNELKISQAELEKNHETVAGQEKQIKDYQQKITDLETRLDDQQSLLTKRQEEIDGYIHKLENSEQLGKKVQSLHREKQARDFEIVATKKKLAEMTSEKIAAERKVAELNQQHARSSRQIAKLDVSLRQVRGSASYRFGNLIVRAAKSPKDALLLPYRLSRFFGGAIYRKFKVRYRAQSATPPPSEPHQSVAVPEQTKISPAHQLAQYLVAEFPDKDLSAPWIGLACSKWLEQQLVGLGNFHRLHPNSWPAIFEQSCPDAIFVDSIDLLQHSRWSHTLQGSARGNPFHLINLLKTCRRRGVKTVLWLNSPMNESREVVSITPLFDEILVADIKQLDYLTSTQVQTKRRLRHIAIGHGITPPIYQENLTCSDKIHLLRERDNLPEAPAIRGQIDPSKLIELSTARFLSPAPGKQEGLAGGILILPRHMDMHNYVHPAVLGAISQGFLPVRTETHNTAPCPFGGLLPKVDSVAELGSLHEQLLAEPELFARWLFAIQTESMVRHELRDQITQAIGPQYFANLTRPRASLVAQIDSYRDLHQLTRLLNVPGKNIDRLVCVRANESDHTNSFASRLPDMDVVFVEGTIDRKAVLKDALTKALYDDIDTVSIIASGLFVDTYHLSRQQQILRGSSADVVGYVHPAQCDGPTSPLVPLSIEYGYQRGTRAPSNAVTLSPEYVRRILADDTSLPETDYIDKDARIIKGPLLYPVSGQFNKSISIQEQIADA